MTKTITFTIKGNPEDLEGNPVPYVRVVGRALWLPNAKRYHAWKEYARSVLYRNYPEYSGRSENPQPFTTKASEKGRMDIKIFWVNGIHADPDNVFKGLADALFKNDKYLDGSFESRYAPDGRGRVDVSITLYEQAQ